MTEPRVTISVRIAEYEDTSDDALDDLVALLDNSSFHVLCLAKEEPTAEDLENAQGAGIDW